MAGADRPTDRGLGHRVHDAQRIAPPNKGFQIAFDNEDASVQHNVAIKDAAGTEVFKGEVFAGVATKTTTCPRSTRARTRSTAPSTPT